MSTVGVQFFSFQSSQRHNSAQESFIHIKYVLKMKTKHTGHQIIQQKRKIEDMSSNTCIYNM